MKRLDVARKSCTGTTPTCSCVLTLQSFFCHCATTWSCQRNNQDKESNHNHLLSVDFPCGKLNLLTSWQSAFSRSITTNSEGFTCTISGCPWQVGRRTFTAWHIILEEHGYVLEMEDLTVVLCCRPCWWVQSQQVSAVESYSRRTWSWLQPGVPGNTAPSRWLLVSKLKI